MTTTTSLLRSQLFSGAGHRPARHSVQRESDPHAEADYLRERARQGSLSYSTFRRLATFDLEAAQAVIWDVTHDRLQLATTCGDLTAASLVDSQPRPETLSELLYRLERAPYLGKRACLRAALAIAHEEGLHAPWCESDARLLRYLSASELDPAVADHQALVTLMLNAPNRASVAQWVGYVAGAAGDVVASEMLNAGIQANHLLGARRHTMEPIWRSRIETEVSAWALGFKDPLLRRSGSNR